MVRNSPSCSEFLLYSPLHVLQGGLATALMNGTQ